MAVGVALGLAVRMRLTSGAVLVRAMVAQAGMLRQRALLARRGLMRRDSYLHLIIMLLTGDVAVAVVAAAVVAAAAVAVPLIRVRLRRGGAPVVLETQVVVAAVVVAAAVREGTEGAVPSGYSLSIMEVGDLWWIVALPQVVEEREVMGVGAEPMVAEPVVGVVVVPSRMAVEAGGVVRVRLEALVVRVVAA